MLDLLDRAGRIGVRPATAWRTPHAAVRLQILSDLHLDSGSAPLPTPAPGIDAVVVAGDTAAGASSAFAFLRAAFPRPLPLVTVLGNREFHGTALGRERRAARSLAALHDITLLDDGVAEVAGLRFVGATLWTDYALHGAGAQPDAMFAASSAVEDHARIALLPEPWLRFRPYDGLAQHHASRRYLAAELRPECGRPTVVVTHHAPSQRSIPAAIGRRPLDGCYASDLDDLVEASGAALWVHGHVHSRCDYMLGRTRVICNPRGRIERCADFDPFLVIEVPTVDDGASRPAGERAHIDHPRGRARPREDGCLVPRMAILREADSHLSAQRLALTSKDDVMRMDSDSPHADTETSVPGPIDAQGRTSAYGLSMATGPGKLPFEMTSTKLAQPDLFADVDESCAMALQRSRRRALPARPRTPPSSDPECAARLLDGHADYRVLRRLRSRPVDPDYQLGPGESVAALVDVETTGLDHRRNEVIEIGMVNFVHDAEGRIGPVVGVLGMLNQPRDEISPEITRLTGITAEMVAGQAIDIAAVRALVEAADLVIAHNAKFDRPFCERLDDVFRHKRWACSVAEVPWREVGFEGAKLGYLVNGCGLFHNGHRAVDDCHALLEVLAHEVAGTSCLSHLLRSAASTRVRVWAERTPFDMKDALKARGYRWSGGGDGRPKAWWTEVGEEDLSAELRFLEREVYLHEVDLRREVLTAYDRHRPA